MPKSPRAKKKSFVCLHCPEGSKRKEKSNKYLCRDMECNCKENLDEKYKGRQTGLCYSCYRSAMETGSISGGS